MKNAEQPGCSVDDGAITIIWLDERPRSEISQETHTIQHQLVDNIYKTSFTRLSCQHILHHTFRHSAPRRVCALLGTAFTRGALMRVEVIFEDCIPFIEGFGNPARDYRSSHGCAADTRVEEPFRAVEIV